MAISRLSQASALQGANEERKGDLQDSTLTAPRSSQRRDADASSASLSGLPDQQERTVR